MFIDEQDSICEIFRMKYTVGVVDDFVVLVG